MPGTLRTAAMLAALVLPAGTMASEETGGASAADAACAEPAAFVMPTTGVAFSLPSDSEADCAVAIPPPPVRPPAPSLFRMVALPVTSGAAKAKWETARLGAVTGQAGPWDELLAQANTVTGGDPVGMVNQWVNWHLRYRDDAGDEWSSAPATLTRGFGDCEDFALAKMGLLLALGVPSDDMYLVLLRDRRQAEHAVLAVKRNGGLFVLDNRTDKVLPAEAVADYTPIVSFSGPFAWTYGRRAG